MSKYCSRCKQEKENSEFGKSKNEPDGLARWCKQCRKDQYQETRELKLEYQKNVS